MKAAKVLAYVGKHWNVIVRLFGKPREKIAQAIFAVYLRAFREDETLPMGGYSLINLVLSLKSKEAAQKDSLFFTFSRL